MAKAKKTQLPKDFETLLETQDLAALQRLFDIYDVNARGGVFKQTALAFHNCPDELARWLVVQGADLNAPDAYGDTPLHARARHWKGAVDVLIELGADLHNGEGAGGAPLHAAAGAFNAANAAALLHHGARVDALDRAGHTPLAYALQRCSNAQIERMAALAEVLLSAGARKTPEMAAAVARIGADFEFHRAGFNPNTVDAASAALDRLYALFSVAPAPRRRTHDGVSPIVAKEAPWPDQHLELWQWLVPSSGHARTVQGEVIRISGRLHDELEGNGGVNWDGDYKRMADALLTHFAFGAPLEPSLLAEARRIVADVKRKGGDARRLCELAVRWVALNPAPHALAKPDYER